MSEAGIGVTLRTLWLHHARTPCHGLRPSKFTNHAVAFVSYALRSNVRVLCRH